MRPLGKKAYGSIPHLPSSRIGEGEHHIHPGQAHICTDDARGRKVYVQHKWDGSNCSVVLLDRLYPLTRSGWVATSSPYEQHRLFHNYVMERADLFMDILEPGQRIVGEWLAQVHGTHYEINDPWDAFVAFDIMTGDERLPYEQFREQINGRLKTPETYEGPMPPHAALLRIKLSRQWIDEPEGVVYRVEHKGQVEFLAKYVRHDKVDGKYLFGEPIWNWRPSRLAA